VLQCVLWVYTCEIDMSNVAALHSQIMIITKTHIVAVIAVIAEDETGHTIYRKR
jgi:hypothetical protein